ncbi:se72 [Alphabaculovirus alterspexiguae]|uniref:Se72 n=1 Tax=Spodoptera exigua multiple nucleopolyhedrovirus TaxID=10454 RepID=A0A3G2JTT6_9ABAC|nr:se72 [Spodoptera exigua multiple nucleopolyhedrovirus]AYN45032.1 se72 [Spodoptera exigua multiple nucleopolyhedrovirus]
MLTHNYSDRRSPTPEPHPLTNQTKATPTNARTANTPPTVTSPPNCFQMCQLNDKNLTTLSRIKYDPELLIHYVFDSIVKSENTNIIKICKVKVKKACGTLLAHYYAQVNVSNGYNFEFHPGSQPRTFQTVHTDGNIILVLILCDACCKEELKSFVEGENEFNVAFKNCESILCKRKSIQTVFITLAIVVLFANIFYFSWYYVLFIMTMIFLLYLNNNYMISNPKIVYCSHKKTKLNGQQRQAKFFI